MMMYIYLFLEESIQKRHTSWWNDSTGGDDVFFVNREILPCQNETVICAKSFDDALNDFIYAFVNGCSEYGNIYVEEVRQDKEYRVLMTKDGVPFSFRVTKHYIDRE